MESPNLRLIHGGVFDDFEEVARVLAGEILHERGEKEGPGGDCPICGGELERGGVHVQRPLPIWAFMTWMFAGLLRPSAWFCAGETGEKLMVIGSWSRTAARCADCGTLLVRES